MLCRSEKYVANSWRMYYLYDCRICIFNKPFFLNALTVPLGVNKERTILHRIVGINKFLISNQYPLDNQLYNVIVGEDVSVNCNYTIPTGQQLDIVAKNSITLGPGFSAGLGSTFNARIEPALYGSSLKSASVDNVQDILATNKDIEIQITDKTFSNEDIHIFPNPNEGSFIVDFGSKDYKNYDIAVTNIQGKLIKSFKELNSSTIIIDLNGNAKGVYVLYLLNNQDKNITTHKIILQ